MTSPPDSRTLTVWCPDWPLFGVNLSPYPEAAPVALLVGEVVLVASPLARAAGVRQGIRRREAQRRCPELVLLPRDENAEMRAFEPVLEALENVCPALEVVRPGVCLFSSKGASRYFGGDRELAAAVAGAVTGIAAGAVTGTGTGTVPTVGVRIGIADSPFASWLAARQSPAGGEPTIVEAGGTPAYLAPFPVSALERPELGHLFVRLGLRTLGDLAAVPRHKVASRFGSEGSFVHRLAQGTEEHRLVPRPPSEEFYVQENLDPPEEQIEPLAFVAKILADRLQGELERRGLGCTRLLVEAESEHGEVRERLWRQEKSLSSGDVAQRVRWQLEGWLTGNPDHRPTSGISLLRLTPLGLRPEDGEQLRLLGGPTDADVRALAAITRLQGLLGFDAVCTAESSGGRAPISYVHLTPWGEQAELRPAAAAPWPGRLPAPHPTVLHPAPEPARVLDGRGELITLTERGVISAVPQCLSTGQRGSVPVQDWGGPWRTQERWWESGGSRSARPGADARLQLITTDGSARLVSLQGARWWIEGAYA